MNVHVCTSAQSRLQVITTHLAILVASPADPADLGGKPGTWYQRDLAAG
jgi:ribosomal-protein-alanine N-acetyltransferase